METAAGSDKAVGLTLLFALVGVAAAVGMYAGGVTHDQVLSGWMFAGAMAAGAVSVAAAHVYG